MNHWRTTKSRLLVKCPLENNGHSIGHYNKEMNNLQATLGPVVSLICSQKVTVKLLSRVQLFATPWTVAYQDPQSREFST